jgi:hypothetical protein
VLDFVRGLADTFGGDVLIVAGCVAVPLLAGGAVLLLFCLQRSFGARARSVEALGVSPSTGEDAPARKAGSAAPAGSGSPPREMWRYPGTAMAGARDDNPGVERDRVREDAIERGRDEAMHVLNQMAHVLDDVDYEELRVRAWRAEQLVRLGVPRPLAARHADHLDWHEIARLVKRGCPPGLALEIVR